MRCCRRRFSPGPTPAQICCTGRKVGRCASVCSQKMATGIAFGFKVLCEWKSQWWEEARRKQEGKYK